MKGRPAQCWKPVIAKTRFANTKRPRKFIAISRFAIAHRGAVGTKILFLSWNGGTAQTDATVFYSAPVVQVYRSDHGLRGKAVQCGADNAVWYWDSSVILRSIRCATRWWSVTIVGYRCGCWPGYFNLLYFSTVVFTTVGFGDIVPFGTSKIVMMVQGLSVRF